MAITILSYPQTNKLRKKGINKKREREKERERERCVCVCK